MFTTIIHAPTDPAHSADYPFRSTRNPPTRPQPLTDRTLEVGTKFIKFQHATTTPIQPYNNLTTLVSPRPGMSSALAYVRHHHMLNVAHISSQSHFISHHGRVPGSEKKQNTCKQTNEVVHARILSLSLPAMQKAESSSEQYTQHVRDTVV
jgi:hypothetical protein